MMLVFRIVKEQYAYNLQTASGLRNRWNADGQFVIYTTSSRALACLENLVHRSRSGADRIFKTMVIDIQDKLPQKEIKLKNLPENWRHSFCQQCLQIGMQWYISNETPVLKVPSSIIPEEWNYILNVRHPQFNRIRLINTEAFLFDQRIG